MREAICFSICNTKEKIHHLAGKRKLLEIFLLQSFESFESSVTLSVTIYASDRIKLGPLSSPALVLAATSDSKISPFFSLISNSEKFLNLEV